MVACATADRLQAITHNVTLDDQRTEAILRWHISLADQKCAKASEHEETSERRPSLTGAARDGQYDTGRDEGTGSAGAEQRNRTKKEDSVRSYSLNPNRPSP
jgi:hypothetical protein